MARGDHWWNEPPRTALVLIVVSLVACIVLVPMALRHGQLPAAEINRLNAEIAAQQAADTAQAEQPPVVAFLGDSYTEGVGGIGYVHLVADDLGVQPRLFAAGQTGYTNPGPPGAGVYGERAAQVVAAAPDVVIIQGGTNDGAPTEEITAAAVALYTELRAGLPGALLVAVGPVDGPELEDARIERARDAVREAAGQAGIPFIDPLAEGWLADPTLFVDDGIHPNDAGYARFAAELAADLRPLLAAR